MLVHGDRVRAQFEEETIAFGHRSVAGSGHGLGMRCDEIAVATVRRRRFRHCVSPSPALFRPPVYMIPQKGGAGWAKTPPSRAKVELATPPVAK
ncbi:hypothetical protein GOALK_061_00480 [Gordonia alkanivorans NBRC 16433]|uniref:Uncharacterized protein n=1 Tax=Gordonia alkanivorans NBRC 16433 TaxID=1027371 RepID=F9VWK3_9ACTN|nr:hypothetical protein GOALK_061_00480 [Gordonia alkanivorans NBRC 16433]